VTDRPSVPEHVAPPTALAAETHRVEAANAADTPADEGCRDASGADSGATRSSDSFDFRLSRSADTPTSTGTVLELFTTYLVAASHARSDALTEPLDVSRVVVDGTVPTDADVSTGYQSAVASLSATLHVATAADDAALERWRRGLRDAEATQEAVPTDTTVSLSVVRTPPTAQDTR
jgi:hypothetical protein